MRSHAAWTSSWKLRFWCPQQVQVPNIRFFVHRENLVPKEEGRFHGLLTAVWCFFFFSCVKCQIRGIATRPCAGSLFYCYLYLHLYLNHGFYDISFSSPPFFFLIFFCYMGLIGSQVKWWWLIQKPRRAWYEMVSINSFFC